LQIDGWCIGRARDIGGIVTEQRLTQAYHEFIDQIKSLCQKDFDKIFDEEESLKVEASSFEGSCCTQSLKE
jgi:hypothetical protein